LADCIRLIWRFLRTGRWKKEDPGDTSEIENEISYLATDQIDASERINFFDQPQGSLGGVHQKNSLYRYRLRKLSNLEKVEEMP
jgi:hypothetical protein